MDAIIRRMPTRQTRILLGSASPRRRRLLSWLNVPYEVTAVETAESLDSPLAADPPALAIALAEEKMEAVILHARPDTLVLTFDTIVALDGKLHGKPTDEADAWRMLKVLSGRTHQVVTACALRFSGGPTSNRFAVVTDVHMHELSDDRINAWIERGEFMGCAGAYNIEEQVADVSVDECRQNVAGLPLCHLYAALTAGETASLYAGAMLEAPVARCDVELNRKCRLGPRVTARTA